MKFKNKDIRVGDLVLIEEKYQLNYHTIKSNRIHVGFVDFMDSSKNIALVSKKLVNTKLPKLRGIRDFFKIFMSFGIANFGRWSQEILNEENIKFIRILK